MDSSADAPVWQAPAGKITGWRDGDVHRATGIRYARAARYQQPRPETEGGEVDATHWSPVCPQSPAPGIEVALDVAGFGTLDADEDCLRVSVTAPVDAAAGERLPVVVFVHGGSYVMGAADAPMHDPAPWCVSTASSGSRWATG